MTIQNSETYMTLDDAIGEVLSLLTGLDLQYAPIHDRYQMITRQLNRAMRAVALEKEWSWYASLASVGPAVEGQLHIDMSPSIRPRMINDDSVRLVDDCGRAVVWAYFLPRDALSKYIGRQGLWCSVTRNTISFSRPFTAREDGLDIQVPVMREPVMFRLPPQSEDPDVPLVGVPQEIRDQPIDFVYPDLVVLRAAYYYAQSDPVMQPRVQTIEAQYKDMMYQITERDDRNTDSPYANDFFVPVQGDISHPGNPMHHGHPHSDERR